MLIAAGHKMQLNNLIEGLTTLRSYYDDPDGHHVGAERDQFFAHPTDQPLRDSDFAKMLALGWSQRIIAGEPGGVAYEPDDAWSCFM
jgi:hypothetical protein